MAIDSSGPDSYCHREIFPVSNSFWILEQRGHECVVGQKSDVVTHLMQWDKQAGKHHTAAATSTQTPAKGQAVCLKWQRESDPDWDTGEDDSPDSEMGLSGEDDGNTDSDDSSPDVEKPRTVP